MSTHCSVPWCCCLMGEGAVFTGRLSLQSHPWLADHVVLGKVLLPGTVFLELALHAAERLDCELVEELTLEAPLVLDQEAAVQLQVRVGAADEHGRRELSMFSQPEDRAGNWIRHAWGGLASEAAAGEQPDVGFAAKWPPVATSALDSEVLYDRFAEAGYEYGPAFQGLRALFTVA